MTLEEAALAVSERASRDGKIPTNQRLLMVLEEVARAGEPLTPTAVNAKMGLPKPTIYRLFATLEDQGFLQRELDGRTYTVGGRLRKLATHVLSSLRVRTARLAVLNALAEKIGETCNIAIPGRDSMVYLDRVETKWPLRIQMPVGTHVPFYCTASGKMYLSTLIESHLERYFGAATFEARTGRTITDPPSLREEIEKTRERGYARDNEEFIEGMIALAVPVLDDLGRLLSTVSFHAPTQRLALEQSYAHLDILNHAASELSKLLIEDC